MKNIEKTILMQVVFTCKQKNNLSDAKTFLKIASDNCYDLLVMDHIAQLQNEIKDYFGSVESLHRCISLSNNPNQLYSIRANLAKMYNNLNDPDSSMIYSKANLEIQKDYDALMELSFSHYLKGDYKTSEKMMREFLLDEDLPEEIKGRIHYNLGTYDLEKGKFKEGLFGFIHVGHEIGIWPNTQFTDVPVWDGKSQPGKTLLIHSEGGIGDELINVRFVENVKKMGMNPIWLSNHNDLVEVFNRNGIISCLNNETIDKSNCVQCMGMYLPLLLDLEETEVWEKPYLKPSEKYLEKWRKILPPGKKLALKWSGNPHYDQDLHRSIPLEIIEQIEYDGTKINLQLEPELFQENMFNAGQHINNIEDTLAILWLCDDLLTSCTSVVHMNGSMGKKGIVCPPIASYYVWLGCEGKSHWYDSNLNVYRQKEHKNWDFVKNVLNKVNS